MSNSVNPAYGGVAYDEGGGSQEDEDENPPPAEEGMGEGEQEGMGEDDLQGEEEEGSRRPGEQEGRPQRAAAGRARKMCTDLAPEESDISDSSKGFQLEEEESSGSDDEGGASGGKSKSQGRAAKESQHHRQVNRTTEKRPQAQGGKSRQGQGSRGTGGSGQQQQRSKEKGGGGSQQGQAQRKKGPGRPRKEAAAPSELGGPDVIPETQHGEDSAATAPKAVDHDHVEDPAEIMQIIKAEEERAASVPEEPKTLWFKPSTMKFVELLGKAKGDADKQMDSGQNRTQKSWLSGIPKELMMYMRDEVNCSLPDNYYDYAACETKLKNLKTSIFLRG